MFEIYAKKGDVKIYYRSILLALCLALFVLSGVMWARYSSQGATAIGYDAHIQIELAQLLLENPGETISQQRLGIDSVNLYTALLALTLMLISPEMVSLFIPLVLGLTSIILGYILLRRFKLSDTMSVVTLSILIISPPFIYTFARSHSIALLVVLDLLMVYFLTDERKKMQYVAIIPALFIFAFGQMHILMTLLIFLTAFYIHTKNRYAFACILLAFLATLAYVVSPFNTGEEFVLKGIEPGLTYTLQNTVSDLGSINGFGIFDVLLLLFGILVCWSNKERYGAIYLFLLLTFLMAIGFDYQLTIYLYFMSAYFIGIGFAGILKRKWSLSLVGELTVIIVICGLLFSSIAYLNRAVHDDPSGEYLIGLYALQNEESGVVLSHYSRGDIISILARKPVLLTDNFAPIDRTRKIIHDTNEVFESRNIETTLELLEKHNVKYIVIDDAMKEGLVWKNENEGLLFLLRNDEIFEDIFKNDEVEIYSVTSYRINTY